MGKVNDKQSSPAYTPWGSTGITSEGHIVDTEPIGYLSSGGITWIDTREMKLERERDEWIIRFAVISAVLLLENLYLLFIR